MNLKALRERLAALKAQAAAKRAEVKGDTPAADATRIEGEHTALLTEIATAQQQITKAEAAERAAQPVAQPATVDADAVRLAATTAAQEAVQADRARGEAIRTLGQRFNQPAFAEEAIRAGTSLAEFRSKLIDKLAELEAAQPRTSSRTGVQLEVVRDETDTRRRSMSDAIVARLTRANGRPGERVEIPEHARQFGEMPLVDIAAECIGWRGNLRTPRQVTEMLERAFHSQSDFPGIFVDAINRRLLARYQAAMPAYRFIAALYTNTDFRPSNVVRAGDFPALQPVAENGEIKAGTFSESKEIFRVYPYGVKFNVSRVMIINDNLRAIDQVIGSAGDRVMDWENAKVFEVVLAGSGVGPVLLTDNKRLFHADHGNYTSSGTAIDIDNVGIGRAAMMKQVSLDGVKLNLTPSVILTGPDRITKAEQLVTSITPAAIANTVPDAIKRLKPVADANISGNAWYLFADPAIAPAFVYGYLEGFEGPRLSTDEPFDVQGLRVKLEHDFGAAGTDFRGAYKNNGT